MAWEAEEAVGAGGGGGGGEYSSMVGFWGRIMVLFEVRDLGCFFFGENFGDE